MGCHRIGDFSRRNGWRRSLDGREKMEMSAPSKPLSASRLNHYVDEFLPAESTWSKNNVALQRVTRQELACLLHDLLVVMGERR